MKTKGCIFIILFNQLKSWLCWKNYAPCTHRQENKNFYIKDQILKRFGYAFIMTILAIQGLSTSRITIHLDRFVLYLYFFRRWVEWIAFSTLRNFHCLCWGIGTVFCILWGFGWGGGGLPFFWFCFLEWKIKLINNLFSGKIYELYFPEQFC